MLQRCVTQRIRNSIDRYKYNDTYLIYGYSMPCHQGAAHPRFPEAKRGCTERCCRIVSYYVVPPMRQDWNYVSVFGAAGGGSIAGSDAGYAGCRAACFCGTVHSVAILTRCRHFRSAGQSSFARSGQGTCLHHRCRCCLPR